MVKCAFHLLPQDLVNEHLSSCSDHEIPIDGVEVKSALQITSLLNTVVKCVEKKEKWNKVLISDLMFSEESDDEMEKL